MKKHNQKGFGLVPPLLFLIIAGLIGFTGWYVWYSKNQADKNLSNASQSSATTTSAPQDGQSEGVCIKSQDQNYYTIKVWKVKAPASTGLHLICTYHTLDYSPTVSYIEFYSTELASATGHPACRDDAYGVNRGLASDKYPFPSDKPIEDHKSFSDIYNVKSQFYTLQKVIGDYFYLETGQGVPCDDYTRTLSKEPQNIKNEHDKIKQAVASMVAE